MYILVSQAEPKLSATIKLSGNLEDRNADLHNSRGKVYPLYLRLRYTLQLYIYINDVWGYGIFSVLHVDRLLHAYQCGRRCVTATWLTV